MFKKTSIILFLFLFTGTIFSMQEENSSTDIDNSRQQTQTTENTDSSQSTRMAEPLIDGNKELTTNILETVGFQSAANLYVLYISIGSLADAFSAKVYNKNVVLQISKEYNLFIKGTIEQLQKLSLSSLLSQEDKEILYQLIHTYMLLQKENQALGNFVRTNQKQYIEDYSSYRQQAWQKIEELLKIAD